VFFIFVGKTLKPNQSGHNDGEGMRESKIGQIAQAGRKTTHCCKFHVAPGPFFGRVINLKMTQSKQPQRG
jgi:hypothetical protein